MIRTPTRAALVIPLLLAACRTAAPTRPATEVAAKRAPAAAVAYVPFSPTIVVAGGEQPFLLLHALVARAGEASAASLDAAFVASRDVSAARGEDAPQRAARSAALLVQALGPVLPDDVHDAEVTAVFGTPGTSGAGITTHLVRGAAGWAATAPGTLHPVLVPPLPMQVARPAAGERAAIEAARRFLERADEGDGDGAWELASAAAKATASRGSFEEALALGHRQAPHEPRREWFRQYDLHTGDFHAGDLLLVCFGSEVGVEAIEMRLDDDQEWRVVDFARPSAVAAREVPSAPATPSRETPRAPSARGATVMAR